jgi:NADP-dependent 3-hydroxy acid dehydrogenase YdfG
MRENLLSGVIAGNTCVTTSISTISTSKHFSIMTVIAVAGGTGGVGKTIVEKLLDSKFDIVVLSRSVRKVEVFS